MESQQTSDHGQVVAKMALMADNEGVSYAVIDGRIRRVRPVSSAQDNASVDRYLVEVIDGGENGNSDLVVVPEINFLTGKRLREFRTFAEIEGETCFVTILGPEKPERKGCLRVQRTVYQDVPIEAFRPNYSRRVESEPDNSVACSG